MSTINFFEVQESFSRDSLSAFLSSFSLIPKGFGHQKNDPEAVCQDRIIGDFELIYVIGGQSFITINHKEYRCVPGDLILIPPFLKHRIDTPAQDPHNNYWLHFEIYPFHLQDSFTKSFSPPGENRVHIGISQELVDLYDRLEGEIQSKKPGNRVMFNALILEILTVILRLNRCTNFSEFTGRQKTSAEVSLVNRSIDFIMENVMNDISIQDVCKQQNISEPYLFKAFRNVLKMPPSHFIQLCKIKRAEQLIKTTELSVKEISDQLCFHSPYYFSNVFKKFYKVSPRLYKQKFIEN